jgi:hypothetical protein
VTQYFRSDGVYFSQSTGQFYVFAVDNKGFSNTPPTGWHTRYFKLTTCSRIPLEDESPSLRDSVCCQVTYWRVSVHSHPQRGQVTYKEGVVTKNSKKIQLLFDDGNIFDVLGTKLEFLATGANRIVAFY